MSLWIVVLTRHDADIRSYDVDAERLCWYMMVVMTHVFECDFVDFEGQVNVLSVGTLAARPCAET